MKPFSIEGGAMSDDYRVRVLDCVVFFLSRIQQRTKIAHDFGALLDRFGGEEAKSGAGAADAVGLMLGNGRHDVE